MHFTFILAGFPLARSVAGHAAATQGPTAILARAERAISHRAQGLSRGSQIRSLWQKEEISHGGHGGTEKRCEVKDALSR
jgi:hypothetical protein